MKTLTTLTALVATLALLVGCQDDSNDPQTIRETGYLSCQPNEDACPGGLQCEDDRGELACVTTEDADVECTELSCACVGDFICGDRGCYHAEGFLYCGEQEWDGCAGRSCGDNCAVCDPDDPECNQPGTPTSCNEDGECVTGTVTCGYDACADKDCGEACNPCDPLDPNCAVPDEETRCNDEGACVEGAVACEDVYEPCADKACGEPCSPCDIEDPDCPQADVETLCTDRGECVEGDVLCAEPYEPCADKICGDACRECDPNDPDCVETEEEKACNENGECRPAAEADCAEMVCEGDGDEPLTCLEGEICCVDRCCGGAEQCCSGIPVPPGEGLCLPAESACPISRRDAKTDIRYLSASDTDRLSQQVRDIQLATYFYKGESTDNPRRLGFIIDDEPGPHTVGPDGTHVDLYGYTSLTVATLQVQARKIELLEAELKALREDVAALKRTAPAPAAR